MFMHILIILINMLWEVFWPLMLGFMISAVIRSYVSTSAISKRLGRSNAKGLALSTFFGAISSSCSYAAASMSRTLVAKGTSWPNAIGFMITSTNMVFEIFLVIVTLLGWAFFGAEVLGGLLFVVIGALFTKIVFTKRSVDLAKKHIEKTEAEFMKGNVHAHHTNMEATDSMHDNHHTTKGEERKNNHTGSGKTLINAARWKDAAGYFYMDISMVGKDILLGVVIASVLAVVVPPHVWQSLFLQQGSDFPLFIITLWNAVIGIIVGLLAFVCSVGNILLAAVLWHGGISFSGVIAFILADLITIPMLLVYRRYYGTKTMWRMLLVLGSAILITAVAVEYIFHLADWIPQSHGRQSGMQVSDIHWNYKTIFNIVLIPLSIIGFFLGKKMMKKKMS